MLTPVEEAKKTGFFKIGNEVFEVEAAEMEGNRNVYKLKCYSAVSALEPFSFGDTKFYSMPAFNFSKRQELTEVEYINHVISLFFTHWVSLLSKNKESDAFRLRELELSSRDAYTKHLMCNDKEDLHKLIATLADTIRNVNEV